MDADTKGWKKYDVDKGVKKITGRRFGRAIGAQ